MESYGKAFAPGTVQNKLVQARTYLSFMIAYDLSILYPQPVDLVLYLQLLANSLKSPQALKNYLSGAKSFILERNGNVTNFTHIRVSNMLRTLVKRSTHAPQQAIALKINVIKAACRWLRGVSTEGEVVAGAILFGLATFLRQCHYVRTGTGSMHLIPRSDLYISEDKAIVTVRSSKTTSLSDVRHITILRVPGDPCCPVQALVHTLALVPASEKAPIFLLPPSGEVLSDIKAVSMFRVALGITGFRNYNLASLHSLRRSGPHACVSMGMSEQNISEHGGWRSKAVRAYLPSKHSETIPKALRSLITSHK